MHTITLFGAGKIGVAITALLTSSNRYAVRICDIDVERAKAIAAQYPNTSPHQLNLSSASDSMKLLDGSSAVLSALPFAFNATVAGYAKKAGVHYLDLTEDVKNTQAVMALAVDASSAFLPQCGLAPGFISIAASHLANGFDSLRSVKLRVGALPIFPSNAFKYNLTWSTEGLINEYAQVCEAIQHGEKVLLQPLEGLERFSLDGAEYECFNTSGGLGTLCDSMNGKVNNLDYKSIRYPGHRDIIWFLMNDLGFRNDQANLCRILERNIPATKQDKVIIFVEVIGETKGQLMQKTYASTVYNQKIGDQHFGAIQVTTASGICAPLDLLLSGALSKNKGLIRLEEIPLNLLLSNEFGRFYADEKALHG